jgi:SAM-dependent MidA family methyltransferase
MTRLGPVSMSKVGQNGLPEPSADALDHSERLRSLVIDRIVAAGGWISFADYMQLALYAPALGYYSAGAAKFGGEGDFVTAPLISPLFSRTCARRISSWLSDTKTDSVLEFGPGTGRFAADALKVLSGPGSPLRRYVLLEVSGDLRARQSEELRAASAVEWVNELPRGFQGVVFANEVLDALPCERFVVRGQEWWRLGVGLGSTGLEWRVRPPDGAAAGDAEFVEQAEEYINYLLKHGETLPDGYCGEWHPWLDGWLNSLSAAMDRGVVLLADYGLPRRQLLHPDRMQGSLRCHYRHYAHGDPFFYPGLCDITAWIDFSAVAGSASRAGFEVAGFTTQTAFLMGAGIEEALQTMAADLDPSSREYLSLARGARTLLLPGEMGESVKFMMLTRHLEEGELGDECSFTLRDLRDSL